VVTGEPVLLERADKERKVFETHLEIYKSGITQSGSKHPVTVLEKEFKEYYMLARGLSMHLLKQEDAGLEQIAQHQIIEQSGRMTGLKNNINRSLNQLMRSANLRVQLSLEKSRREIRLQLKRTLIIGITALSVLLFLLIYISRRIIIPIGALSQMTKEVARGNFIQEREVPLLSSDEVGELANAFVSMKRELKETTVSKAYVDNIIRSMGDSLFVLSNNFCIIAVNEAALRMLHYKRGELIGEPFESVLAGEAFESWCRQESLFSKGLVSEKEKELLTSDKRRIPVIFSCSVLHNNIGRQQGLVCVAQDITPLKQAEAELESRADELARSNAELEQFAYVASHDLQEPLRMVVSYLQLLSRRYKGKLDADAEEFIHYAVDGSIRMKGLINDLLTYSRVTTAPKNFQPVNMEEVMQDILISLKAAIDESGARVVFKGLPTVTGEPRQLRQLLQNLVGNAVKYHGKEPPLVQISAQKNKRFWEFAVRDNGIGILPEYQERIFVIFQRLHTREEYSGSGIGLAICKKIVERHKGRIWIESDPEQGSCFYFTLPV
jgi:PAS domain S-box-containing protein